VLATSALSRLTIGAGRPAGATSLCQAMTTCPGKPASAMVGTSVSQPKKTRQLSPAGEETLIEMAEFRIAPPP
jgi:hypothetical protein